MHPLSPGAIPFFVTSGHLRSPDLLFYQDKRIPYLNFPVSLTADYLMFNYRPQPKASSIKQQ